MDAVEAGHHRLVATHADGQRQVAYPAEVVVLGLSFRHRAAVRRVLLGSQLHAGAECIIRAGDRQYPYVVVRRRIVDRTDEVPGQSLRQGVLLVRAVQS